MRTKRIAKWELEAGYSINHHFDEGRYPKPSNNFDSIKHEMLKRRLKRDASNIEVEFIDTVLNLDLYHDHYTAWIEADDGLKAYSMYYRNVSFV